MNIRMLRSIVLPAVLCAGLAVAPLPAAGQSGAGADSPEQVAKTLAEALVDKMVYKRIKRQRVALLPLDPDEFHATLNRLGQQQLYVLLAESLQVAFQRAFEWVDLSGHKDLSRMLQERYALGDQGEGKWFDHYKKVLGDSLPPLNISCKAGPLRRGKFKLTCSVLTLGSGLPGHATASGEFSSDWLMGPVDPESAIALIAGNIVRSMKVKGVIDVESGVDSKTKRETSLVPGIAVRLKAKVDEIMDTRTDWKSVGGEVGPTRYRAAVKVQRFKETLDLQVELYSGAEETSGTTFWAPMHWTERLRELDAVVEDQPVSDGECEPGANPGERRLPDEGGRKLKHWALKTENDLLTGDYDRFRTVLVKAKIYLEEHCQWERVAKIMDIAIAGLVKELDVRITEGARSGLEDLLAIEKLVEEPRPALLLLRARAYELLNYRREQNRAYTEWLDTVPDDDPEVLLPILEKQDRILAEIRREDAERALDLGGPERSLVRRGLVSFGYDGGTGTAEFDTPFRAALRSWQAKNDRKETGYLTREQAQVLMDSGREVEESARDDAAFARAKAADTVAAYQAYLSEFPNGRHEEEARRRLDVARAREDEARAWQEAEAGEQALALKTDERVLVERGLASWKSGGGGVDGRLDAAFRALLRSWQASKGHSETGYLTAEQAQELMAEGRAAGEREKDDAAFAGAKAADTAEAYLSYLSEHPSGRHVTEARRLLEAVRVREDDAAFARAKRSDTAAAYAAYLSQYSDGRHAAEARRLREAAQVREAAEAEEEALGLTWAERELVQRGLASKVRAGAVNGRFHTAFRAALRSWQASNGHTATGYLTREQAQVLMDLGREAERDDAAFARAKSANTVASYDTYLSEYPSGQHVAEAKRRRDEIRAELMRAEESLEKINRERAQCMATDRSRLTEGAVFCDCTGCPVMVVGKGGVATSKYPVRHVELNACVEDGVCGGLGFAWYGDEQLLPSSELFLTGKVAQTYVDWLGRKTRKRYRLLTESGRSHDPLDDDSLLGGELYRVARNVGGTAGNGAAATETRLGLSNFQRRLIQRALNTLGFDAGGVDGDFGRRTRKALRTWQASNGYARTGYLTADQAAELLATAKSGAYAQSLDLVDESVWIEERLGRSISASWKDGVGWTDLHYAAMLDFPAVVTELVERGTPVDVRLKGDKTPFGERLIRTLDRMGLGDRFKGWKALGQTPLMLAALVDARDAFAKLVELGADTTARNSVRKTPLHYAAQSNALQLTQFLVRQSSSVDVRTSTGVTPLHLASYTNALDTARLLVERGADINARTNKGTTPLHFAAQRNARETAQILIEHGANVNATDDEGRTPHDVATSIEDESKRAEMRRLLRIY